MRGKKIEEAILKELNKSQRPLSTRDLSLRLGVSWHPIMNHCLRLQMQGRIEGYKFGNINAWVFKR